MKGYLLISRQLDVPRYLLDQRPFPILRFGETGRYHNEKPIYGYHLVQCLQKPDLSNEVMGKKFKNLLKKAVEEYRIELLHKRELWGKYMIDLEPFMADLHFDYVDCNDLLPSLTSQEIDNLVGYKG